MSDRTAEIVEVVSIVAIGLAVLVFGWAILQNLARFRGLAGLVLVILAALQTAAIRRDLGRGGAAGRVRATRDVAFVAAMLMALAYLATYQRWAIGATIASVEFAIVLELLARVVRDAPGDVS